MASIVLLLLPTAAAGPGCCGKVIWWGVGGGAGGGGGMVQGIVRASDIRSAQVLCLDVAVGRNLGRCRRTANCHTDTAGTLNNVVMMSRTMGYGACSLSSKFNGA